MKSCLLIPPVAGAPGIDFTSAGRPVPVTFTR
ncbi:hypothetical protein OPIT5_25490 [Opitutaceae bacterium TAV5]|nr:hypothetical protein OPIT5_25490 [Opitutaceae bacterium TAV5]